ncbi:p-Nitrophenyl phosphatase [Handroanthus impetiginosus]|uniref:phosphoglycolate phosphatase n=1 Tax=Handroanthus impetiginosus TaxID=429701 RepID=A0A2G9G782_9LAMI|nr:p-Nitrophenyl phosphatase [Handroanthus impetiginosus]
MDGEKSSRLTMEEASSCQSLTPQTTVNLLDSVDAFLFDCDGVIWKGDALIDGVSDTLDMLRAMGKKLVFVTNNSTKSRRQYAKKFHSVGISVSEDEIFSSSFAAAMYLKVNDFPKEKKVYVIGEDGILEELKLAGFTGLGGPEDGKKTVQLKPNNLFEHDKNVGAVVVGLDQYINFYKLQYGTLCIRENPGCLFIATNRDAVGHLTDLQEWPGAGCMVAAICGTTQKEPIVVGKPSTFLMDFLLQKIVDDHFFLQEDGKKTVQLKPNNLFEHDKNVGAVVVGLDQYINFYKLQYGTLCIRENPGCLFIATNRDAVGHLTDLQEWPGAGCMVAAICGTTQKEPIVVGKPSTFLMDFLLQKYNIPTSRMCMVGDRLDTDILFGQNAGCRTLLVFSGVTSQSDLEDPSNHIKPEYYTSKLSDIVRLFNNYQSSL